MTWPNNLCVRVLRAEYRSDVTVAAFKMRPLLTVNLVVSGLCSIPIAGRVRFLGKNRYQCATPELEAPEGNCKTIPMLRSRGWWPGTVRAPCYRCENCILPPDSCPQCHVIPRSILFSTKLPWWGTPPLKWETRYSKVVLWWYMDQMGRWKIVTRIAVGRLMEM